METAELHILTYVLILTLQNPELQLPALYPQNGFQWTALSSTAVSLFLDSKCIHILCICAFILLSLSKVEC